MFLLFLAYTLLVFLRHKNRDKALGVKLHRLVNEFAYAHLFFFIAAILVHVLTLKMLSMKISAIGKLCTSQTASSRWGLSDQDLHYCQLNLLLNVLYKLQDHLNK